jgi:hypothetical protein
MKKMSSVDMTKKAWESMSVFQKKQMLKTLGFNESFARVGTMDELVSRGGGMVARDFHNVVKTWKTRNPNTKIKWEF